MQSVDPSETCVADCGEHHLFKLLKSHLVLAGERPQVLAMLLRHMWRSLVAWLHLFLMCVSHLKCLSKVTPRYLTSSEKFMVSSFSLRAWILYFLLNVEKIMALVLIVLSLTPFSEHHLSISLRYLFEVSLMVTLRSVPIMRIARSSAKA